MGSGGGIWDAADAPSAARLNQKSTFVGIGTQIAALATTYAGQFAYATSTTGGFTIDVLYVRNAANTAWVNLSFTEVAEANTTPVTDGADFTVVAGTRYYAFFTLPTTEKLYIITGMEWKNTTSAQSGNITCGVDIVDANPPTITSVPLLANSQEVAQAAPGGSPTVQRVSIISSRAIRGGTICGAWVSCSSGTAKLREQTGLGSQNQSKATAYTVAPPTNDTTTWTATTARKYLKIYFVGYN